MNLPSIKTLKTITPDRAKELRSVLEITKRSDLETLLATGKYPATDAYTGPCSITKIKLSIADEILGTCGVEYIYAGHNAKSPAIEYCNTGDSYAWTLMYVSGKGYRVGCWGDIVERGNYD